jgi:hypothetical protein
MIKTFGPTLLSEPPPTLYLINIVVFALGVTPNDKLLIKSPI